VSRAPESPPPPATPDDSDLPDPSPLTSNDVRERTADLFVRLLDEAEHILKAGTPANKIALMKSVIPVLMRELQSADDSATLARQKAALDGLFARARGDISGFDDE